MLIKPQNSDKLLANPEEAGASIEPHPDNSTEVVNLFLKGFDKSWTVQDLHELFREYGEIKSAKISINPDNGKSRKYGYLWFKNP